MLKKSTPMSAMHERTPKGATRVTARRSNRRVTLFRSMLVSGACIAVACSVFSPPPSLTNEGGTGGSGGAAGSKTEAGEAGGSTSTDGGTNPWWPYKNKQGCSSAGVPTGNDRPSDTPSGNQTITLAINQMLFGASKVDPKTGKLVSNTTTLGAWEDIGFDLDQSCTNSPTCCTTGTCPKSGGKLLTELACKNPSGLVPADGNNCRDNEIGHLFGIAAASPRVGPLFYANEQYWDCALWRGSMSVILRISGYNGQLNDQGVRLDMYTSLGLEHLPSWYCKKPGSAADAGADPAWQSQAAWLPTRHWKIADSSIPSNYIPDGGTALPQAKVADTAAFVRNGYLFAQLPPPAPLWLDGQNALTPGFRFVLYRGILVGKLQQTSSGTWSITDGTIAGVVKPDDMVNSFRQLGFCSNMCADYDNVVQYLNTYQDTLSTTSDKLPGQTCDSLSFAADFTAAQAVATAQDIVPANKPVDCPQPRNPDAPRQGCTCPDGGPLVCPTDGGTDGGKDAGKDGGT